MKVNISDWEKQFDGQVKISLNASLKTIDESCQILYQRIVERTPIGDPNLWNPPYWPKDYQPGFLKSNWKFERQGNTWIISNDAAYAYRIETGWSTKQAPTGMMRISVLEFEDILNKVATKNRE